MELYYYVFLSIAFLFIIRPILRKSSQHKMPPGPTGFPIVGSLLQLGPRVHESLFHMAKRHGELMTLRLGAVTTVVASSPKAAQEIIGKHDHAFAERTVPDAIAALPNPEGTLGWVPGDHAWRNRRRVCTKHLFSSNRVDALQGLRHEKIQKLISHIDIKYRKTGKPVDIGKVAFGMSLNIVSSTLFSEEIVNPEFESTQDFKNIASRIMEGWGKLNISDYFPFLRPFDLQGIRKVMKAYYERYDKILEEIIEKRVKDRASGSIASNSDFLDILLSQCQEAESGFDRQNIKALILEFFIAGSDTTAITIEWAMAELLRKPSALQKARKEILTTVGTERPVQESDIQKLPYIEAVVKETLRLHPAGPLLLPYKAKADTEVLGYIIPKGVRVLVNVWAIGRDPNYWTEPMEFRPERFTAGSSVGYMGVNFEYIPFGAGRRICPGIPLAVRMVPFVVASLLQAFTWRLPGGFSTEDLDMEEKFGITLKKAKPLRAIPS